LPEKTASANLIKARRRKKKESSAGSNGGKRAAFKPLPNSIIEKNDARRCRRQKKKKERKSHGSSEAAPAAGKRKKKGGRGFSAFALPGKRERGIVQQESPNYPSSRGRGRGACRIVLSYEIGRTGEGEEEEKRSLTTNCR